jgi:hypothetical protein
VGERDVTQPEDAGGEDDEQEDPRTREEAEAEARNVLDAGSSERGIFTILYGE